MHDTPCSAGLYDKTKASYVTRNNETNALGQEISRLNNPVCVDTRQQHSITY